MECLVNCAASGPDIGQTDALLASAASPALALPSLALLSVS